jgi:hypothetical protein
VPEERLEAHLAGPDPDEEGSGCLAAGGAPGVECGDGVGEGVLAVRDGDLLAVAVSVSLGLADV